MKKFPIIMMAGMLFLAALLFFNSEYEDQELSIPQDSFEETVQKQQQKSTASGRRLASRKDMPDMNELSPKVSFIVGLEDAVSFIARDREALDIDPNKLTKNDYQALMAFMDQQPGEHDDTLKFHSLKNSILILLIKSGRYKYDLGYKMIEMVDAHKQDPVWKEYTVQFIPEYFEKHLSGNHLNHEEKDIMNKMIDIMWNATQVQEGALAGTALMKLNQLSNDNPIDQNRIIESAERVLTGTFDDASQMGAIDVLLQNHSVEHFALLNNLTFDNSAPVTVRMIAMNAASRLSNDQSFLERLKEEILTDATDKRLKVVADKIINSKEL